MINVTASNNLKRANDLFPANTTLREALDALGIDYTRGMLTMDSAPLQPGDLNKTFAEMGYDGTANKNRCFLASIVKADNA